MSYRDELSKLGMGSITRTGKYICPRCSGNRKNKHDRSLSVTFQEDGVLYKCHNVGCDLEGFITFENRYAPKIIKTYNKPMRKAEDTDKTKLIKYFQLRGISEKTINDYQIGIKDKFIIFNYFKNGELVNIKTRENLGDGKKTFYQEKDTEKTFYGMDLVPETEKKIIICEGEIDVLSFYECGLYAISVPQGAGEKKLECIDNCWEFLQRFDEYIIAVDSDAAGKVLEDNLIHRLGKEKCKLVDWTCYDVKGKDANEFLIKEKQIIIDAINNAEFVPLAGITSFKSNEEKILKYFESGFCKGQSTGWEKLDKIFTIKRGYLMIITGIPTRGKSFFTDNLMVNLSKQYCFKHLIVSFENTLENHFSRFYAMFMNKSFSKNISSSQEISEAIRKIDPFFLRLELDRGWGIDDIIMQAEYAVKRYGIDTLLIDPYNRLDRSDMNDREDLYIGDILKKLSLCAKRLNILVMFVAHPKKLSRDEGSPDMYSISGSADWYNMADYGITIHRDKGTDGKLSSIMQVIVHKVKDITIGDPAGGTIELTYNHQTFVLED